MGGIIMPILIISMIVSIIVIIIAIIFNISKFGEDRETRIFSAFTILLVSFFLGVVIHAITTPTIEDYLHGKVKIEVQQIYENGEFVRCDTSYYKL